MRKFCLHTKDGGLLPCTCGKPFNQMLNLMTLFPKIYLCNQINFHTYNVMFCQHNMVKKIHQHHYTCQLKKSHDLIVGIHWSINEFVVVIIHLAQKHEYVVRCLLYTKFSFLSPSLRGHFGEVQARALWDVANCNMYAMFALDTMLIITTNLGYGREVTVTTQFPSKSLAFSHFFG